ncbi:MAG: hypothetical protein A2X64_05705 [Ignavibacteria bacterium GWF2_33_9]|nr:MAG: hypothetical protein A2X64_05705 [Ignavibacteria bacterium GWF2_33_9]
MQDKYKIIPLLTPSLFAFTVSQGKWKFAPHLRLIEQKLIGALQGKNRHLIFTMPPRHGKSEFISKYFPLWYLLTHPEKRVILASYQVSLSEFWSRKIRELIQKFGLLFGVKLNPGNRKAGSFSFINHEGGLNAVGVGGALTGKGADLLIIDDPIKNDAEANSSVYREKIWDWFNATAFTRLEPDGICIIVMTRWHEDDLVGRLIAANSHPNGINWELVNLPALAQGNDPLERKLNEPLWKARFSLMDLLRIKESIGTYWFSALYQQSPVPAGNSIFNRKDFRYFEDKGNHYELFTSPLNSKRILKSEISIFATSDLALSLKETADYTIVLIFGKLQSGEILILDIIRERFESTEHLKLFASICAKWMPKLIGIENVQFQQSLIQQAVKIGLPIKQLKADKDKISRALPIAAMLENGMIYFRKDAGYLEEFEKELLQFPRSKHDDQVDAFAYIFQLLNKSSGLLPV